MSKYMKNIKIGDTIFIIKDEEARIYLDNLRSQIQGLASGSPLVATSTSGMTDTTKIYVNTSDGNWYYFNGTEWVSGGKYQTAENSSVLEGVNSHLKTKNIKDLMEFVIGDISGNDGKIVGSTKRIVTKDIQKFDFDLYIPASKSLRTYFYFYSDLDGTSFTTKLWNTNVDMIIPAGTCFRLLVALLDETNVETLTEVKTSKNYIDYEIYNYNEYFINKKKNFNERFIETLNLKYLIDFAVGDFKEGNAFLHDSAYYKRLISKNILCFSKDIVIPKSDKFNCYLCTYPDREGTSYERVGWVVNNERDYIIPAGTYFRMLVKDTVDSNIIYDIYDNSVFNNLELYIRENKNETNKNIKFVAHQGYSLSEQYYGNCRLSSYEGAKEKGFDFGECDIKFTSDNIPVCCHDATFTDTTTNELVTIADCTLEQLKTKNYFGETIASFEEVIKICKEIGLGLYIDHLGNIATETQWNTVFAIVKKYAMEDNIKWLAYNETQANKILTWYKKAKISIVTSESDLTNVITLANAIKTDYNEITIDFDYSKVNKDNLINYIISLKPGVNFEVWTIDDIETVKTYLPYVKAITSNKISSIDL